MAEVIRYVDPDATGTGDGTSWANAYTSLQAWGVAEETDLVTAMDTHTVYCRSSDGTADTGGVVNLLEWTTSSDYYVAIKAAEGDEALKTGWSNSRYRLAFIGHIAAGIDCRTGCVYISGLQLDVRAHGSGHNRGTIRAVEADSTVYIDGVRIGGSADVDIAGISISHATVVVTNTIIDSVHTFGIAKYSSSGPLTVYNSVFNGLGIGIFQFSGSVTVKNSAVFNCTDDFDGTITVDYCASDDGDGTNSVGPAGDPASWDNEFSDPATGDFTLLNTGNLYDAGVGPGADANVPVTDIEGDTRAGDTCDIGVDEYAGGKTYPWHKYGPVA